MANKPKHPVKGGITVNGVPAKVIIEQMLFVANKWGKMQPTKRNINLFGLEILSDFCRSFNMRLQYDVVDLKKKRKKK